MTDRRGATISRGDVVKVVDDITSNIDGALILAAGTIVVVLGESTQMDHFEGKIQDGQQYRTFSVSCDRVEKVLDS